jgi:hypothetical protein
MKYVFSIIFLSFARNTFCYDTECAILNMKAKIHKDPSAKCPLLLSDFNQNLGVTTNIVKFPCIRFHENRLSGSRVVSCVQADRHDQDSGQIFAKIRREHAKNIALKV